jgi:uncharacterized membrane protein YedE/YeeE
VTSDVMSAVASVAQAHRRVDGIWFVFYLLLGLGVLLMVNGALSLLTRRLRGHDAPPGQIRGMERAAGGSLRVGRAMTVIGGLGFGFWWVVVR